MDIIDVGRGSHKAVISGSGSYVTVDGFTPPGTGSLVADFRIQQREKTATIQCFNEVNHVYAFGHDPENSPFSVSYLVFLGSECMQKKQFSPSSDLRTFISTYLEKRVSAKKSAITVTYRGAGSIRGIVTGFDVSVLDQEMHICSVTLSGKCM